MDTAPYFSRLASHPELADVDVVVVEVEDGRAAPDNTDSPAPKRARLGSPEAAPVAAPDRLSTSVPAHGAVLVCYSRKFSAQIALGQDMLCSVPPQATPTPAAADGTASSNDKDELSTPSSRRFSIRLEVPAGQLQLGERLICCLYEASPDLSDLSQQQLLQLTALADYAEVPKVLAAAAAALAAAAAAAQKLCPETARGVFDLPDACLQLECMQPVSEAAAVALLGKTADLEHVWRDPQAGQWLWSLPFGALTQLLLGDTLRVASEDTVVAAIEGWLAEHPGTSAAERSELAGTLRLLHCSASFLWGVLNKPNHRLHSCGWPAKDLILRSQSVIFHRQVLGGDHATWLRPRRPSSAVSELRMRWNLQLSDLQQAVEACPSGTFYIQGAAACWQGRTLTMGIRTYDGVFAVCMCADIDAACSRVSVRVRAVREHGHSSGSIYDMAHHYLQAGSFTRLRGLPIPDTRDWAVVAQHLREAELVHPDGTLHLRVTVGAVS